MKKLLIVTAVCSQDYQIALKRAKWMSHLKQVPDHTLLLVNDSTVDDLSWAALVEAYTHVFETVVSRKISAPRTAKWPEGVNHVWRSIASSLISQSPMLPVADFIGWFYFEPDVTPLKPIWAGVLDQNYALLKLPFMGVKSVNNAMRGKEKTTVTSMNGAGVYPFEPTHFSQMMMLADGAPWDIFLYERLDKIAFMPDSAYCLTYGVTECRMSIGGLFKATKTVQDGTVTSTEFELKDQILHHGCKDGSLIDCLTPRESNAPEVVPSVVRKQSASYWKRRNLPPKKVKQAKAGISEETKAQIREARDAGMKWGEMIGKYKINPSALKQILTPAEA